MGKIEKELLKRPGLYKSGRLKKSYNYIANYFGVTEENIREAVYNLKKGNTEYQEAPRAMSLITDKPNVYKVNTPGTYWVTGCAHAPWHNKRMYESTLNFLDKEVDLEGIILAGDFLDMNSLSSHDRGKVAIKGVSLDWEYEESSKFLDQIDELGRSKLVTHKYFLQGNHEDRYFRALSDVNVSKYGKALKSPSEGLKLAERGYLETSDWKTGHIDFGPYLEINHGEFFNIHSAKKTIDTYRKSVMYFHSHRKQYYIEGNVGGYNMGSGADFNAPVFNYATRAMKASWFNCSAIVTLDEDGYYHIQSLDFINNKLIVNGRLF